MGLLLDRLRPDLVAFAEAQPLWFVASAPLAADGHVNVSPKGLDSFRVIDDTTVAYLDLTGSGVETISHLAENGRITLLFCSYGDKPQLLRLYGRGEAVRPHDDDFDTLVARFPSSLAALASVRSIIRVHLHRVTTSCGYGVPQMDFVSERGMLEDWAERKGLDGVVAYQDDNNTTSIDGLPGLISS
ncbi:MAG TPA: pyridoxamine 5'-phosphate oxidase family protein [Acidimicrobiales bacterium]|nr:pyridoxamine 5'-phosphate oxidase family protein [Acidimicrobiales bacterium]